MKNKYVIYFITFVLAVIATLNICVSIYARQYVKYEIDVNNEVRLDNITVNNISNFRTIRK